MSVFSNKKENFNIKISNSIDEINNILKENGFLLKDYKYDLQIFMISKNENFSKIKNINDIKEYAIIKDENGSRKVILNNQNNYEAKVYSIFLIRDLLYNFGFYELFYINQDIYSYEMLLDNNIIDFKIISVKNQGCFLKCNNLTSNCLKQFISNLQKMGLKIDKNDFKIDYIQNELNKVLFKRKK